MGMPAFCQHHFLVIDRLDASLAAQRALSVADLRGVGKAMTGAKALSEIR